MNLIKKGISILAVAVISMLIACGLTFAQGSTDKTQERTEDKSFEKQERGNKSYEQQERENKSHEEKVQKTTGGGSGGTGSGSGGGGKNGTAK